MRHIAILNELQNIKLNGRPEEIEANVSRMLFLERASKKLGISRRVIRKMPHMTLRGVLDEDGRVEQNIGKQITKKWPNKLARQRFSSRWWAKGTESW